MAHAYRLTSEAVIDHDNAVQMVEKMRDDHSDLGSADSRPGSWDFPLHYGSVSARLEHSRVRIRVFAEDDTNLSYVKMEVAAHAAELLGSTGGIHWSGQADTPQVPAFFREIRVVSSRKLSPHMQRIRFEAHDISRYATGGLHIRLLIPPAGRTPVWPTIGHDGLFVWPTGDDTLTVRIYTIRTIDVEAGTFDVDFVLHPGLDTPAATFAQTARPGDQIGMIGPGGNHIPENGNLLLLGDDTALPAISRILENLAPETHAEVYLEVDSEADILPIASPPTATITWLLRKGRPAGTTGLLSGVLRQIDPSTLPDDLYIWSACEFQDFREIRRIVRKEWRWPKARQLVVSYWRQGLGGEDARHAED